MTLRNTLALTGIAVLSVPFSDQGPVPAVAQEVVQDEGAFYRAFHEASQAGDTADQAVALMGI